MLIHGREIEERRDYVAVLRARGLLPDGERLLEQRFRPGELFAFGVVLGQVIQASRQTPITRPKGLGCRYSRLELSLCFGMILGRVRLHAGFHVVAPEHVTTDDGESRFGRRCFRPAAGREATEPKNEEKLLFHQRRTPRAYGSLRPCGKG